jgi:hypothetical protein
MLRGSTFRSSKPKEAAAPAVSTPGSERDSLDESTINGQTEAIAPEEGPEGESDAGKLKQLLSVLKKVIGVKVRLSVSSAWMASPDVPYHRAGSRESTAELARQPPRTARQSRVVALPRSTRLCVLHSKRFTVRAEAYRVESAESTNPIPQYSQRLERRTSMH